jgi:hypothetical protein
VALGGRHLLLLPLTPLLDHTTAIARYVWLWWHSAGRCQEGCDFWVMQKVRRFVQGLGIGQLQQQCAVASVNRW